MPTGTSALDDEPIDRSYAFMQPAHRPQPTIVIRASEIGCPACNAGAGKLCAGTRICPERIELARNAAAAGDLEAAEHVDTRCRYCARHNGRDVACPDHRCYERGCVGVKVHGTDRCEIHTRRGRKSAKTPAKLARLDEMRAAGRTVKEICAALGISDSTYYHWQRQGAPASD